MNELVKRENGAPQQAGVTLRQEFGAQQMQTQAETSMAAAAARERAIVEAEYIMAERHPRAWMNVRAVMLDHCSRPRFAEIARYAKPVGKEKINGEWVEKKVKGFSSRFAETLAQEMGNVKPISAVTFEDDLIRIMRIGVIDLERNIPRAREVTFARSVEKRGKKNKAGEWAPPDGREVISSRINSYGEPTYLVRATDDELRSKVNSEESKTQRDFILKLCPRDILEECEDKIRDVLAAEDKRDPLAALKKLLDRFREFGVMPSDLETYMGKPSKQFTAADIQELRELGAAIRDGQETFQNALRLKFSAPEGEESAVEHDARLRKQSEEQLATAQQVAAEKKIAELTAQQAPPPPAPPTETAISADDENRELDRQLAEQEREPEPPPAPAPSPFGRPAFGRKPR